MSRAAAEHASADAPPRRAQARALRTPGPGRRRAPWDLDAATEALARELRAGAHATGIFGGAKTGRECDRRRTLANALYILRNARDARDRDAPAAHLGAAAARALPEIESARERFTAALGPLRAQLALLHPTEADEGGLAPHAHALRCELPSRIAASFDALHADLSLLVHLLRADHLDEDGHRDRCEREVLPLLRATGLSYAGIARLLDGPGFAASAVRATDRIRKALGRVGRSRSATIPAAPSDARRAPSDPSRALPPPAPRFAPPACPPRPARRAPT